MENVKHTPFAERLKHVIRSASEAVQTAILRTFFRNLDPRFEDSMTGLNSSPVIVSDEYLQHPDGHFLTHEEARTHRYRMPNFQELMKQESEMIHLMPMRDLVMPSEEQMKEIRSRLSPENLEELDTFLSKHVGPDFVSMFEQGDSPSDSNR